MKAIEPSNKISKLNTQLAMSDFIQEIENLLTSKFNISKIIFPSFEKSENIFENNFNGEFKSYRKINFDSFHNYEIYSLFHNYQEYLLKTYFQFLIINKSKIKGIFVNSIIVERDQDVKNILEIESKKIEGIFEIELIQEKGTLNFLTNIYKIIFDSYKKIRRIFSLDLIIPKEIKFYDSTKELNFSKTLDIKIIKKDILEKEGLIFWINDTFENKTFELLAISKISNEIIKLFSVTKYDNNLIDVTFENLLSINKMINTDIETIKINLESKALFYLDFNLTQTLTFLLEKSSSSELFFIF